jgi:hypothetical protein
MKKKYQVFISSTFVDLKREREEVAKKVLEMGFIPSGMEFFPATSMDQLKYIKLIIDDCDYYVLVIGGRYGSTTEDGISFTEAEYDYAVEQKKNVLAFIHENPGSFRLDEVDADESRRTKFRAFREKVLKAGSNAKFWNTKEELAAQALTSLHHATQDYPGIGWIRGDFATSKEAINEFRLAQSNSWRLQHEVSDLKEKLTEALSAISAMFLDKTKPATQAEVDRWLEGAKVNYPSSDDWRVFHGFRDIRFAQEDFILPPLYGTSAVAVLVAPGVRVYRPGGTGHSTLLYMDGFRKEGLG